MKKQSVKRGIWYIGGRRKRQRGGAFLVAVLAAPILGYLGSIVFLKKIEVKQDDADVVKDKILLQRHVNPKKVDLPDGQTF